MFEKLAFIEEKYEAGISLAGTEVKSLRMMKLSLPKTRNPRVRVRKSLSNGGERCIVPNPLVSPSCHITH